MLPDPDTDPRADSTALVFAISGVACPVLFVMSVAAIKMAGDPRRSRRAAAAYGVSVLTIVLHAALVVFLATRIV